METSKLTISRIKEYLSQGKRFDGRKPEEFREIFIEKNISKKAEGSVRVKIGKTEVLVGIKLDVGEPYPDSKDKGNLITSAELLPLSSERFELGPPKIDAIELGRIIDRGVRESKFIDFEKLCIKEGEKVWTVYIDIYSINDDGNLLDAAGIGAIVALKNAKMPKYDEKEETVLFDEKTNTSVPLSDNIPFSITIRKIGNKFLVDPTIEEEDAEETRITMGVSKGDIMSSMQKGKETSLTIEQVSEALDLAEKAWKTNWPKIEKFLK